MTSRNYRIGIFGNHPQLSSLVQVINHQPSLSVVAVYTSATSPSTRVKEIPLVKSSKQLLRTIDLLVECSGTTVEATDIVMTALTEGIPVVTMNVGLHLVSGTQLASLGTIVEAEGDQPGTLASLDNEVRSMGFSPVVYGSIKNFVDFNPTPESMLTWTRKLGQNLPEVTAATDGTTIQMEQAMVANFTGATISGPGLSGIRCRSVEEGARRLAEIAEAYHAPISDYILLDNQNQSPTPGVFIVATHNDVTNPQLTPLRLGDSAYFLLTKPYHLNHLEIPKTILAVLTADHRYTLTNSANPTVQVVATPKTKLLADHYISHGVGSFELRGEAVAIKDYADCVPISLLEQARLKRPVPAGEYIRFIDVNLPESKALAAWMKTLADLGYYTPRKARPKKVITTPPSSQSNWTNSLLNMFNLLKVSQIFSKKVWYGSK